MISSSSYDQVILLYFTFISISDSSGMDDKEHTIAKSGQSEKGYIFKYTKDSWKCHIPSAGLFCVLEFIFKEPERALLSNMSHICILSDHAGPTALQPVRGAWDQSSEVSILSILPVYQALPSRK